MAGMEYYPVIINQQLEFSHKYWQFAKDGHNKNFVHLIALLTHAIFAIYNLEMLYYVVKMREKVK